MQYLPLLQGDLALLFAADKRPVTPEHSVASMHNMGKGCREETISVLYHPLEEEKAQALNMREEEHSEIRRPKTTRATTRSILGIFRLYLYRIIR